VVDGPISHKDEFPQTVSTDCFTPFVHALSHTPVSAYRAGQTQTGEVPGSEPQGGVSTHISYFHTLDIDARLLLRRAIVDETTDVRCFSHLRAGRAQHRSRGRVCYGELPVTFTADTVVRRGVNACVRTVCASLSPVGPHWRLGPRTDDCCARVAVETR